MAAVRSPPRLTRQALRPGLHPGRRIPVMKDQCVSVRISEIRLVADAAVQRLALKLDPFRLQLGSSRLDILDVEGDGACARLEVPADLGDIDYLNRETAGLELAAKGVVVPLGALETKNAAIERFGFLEARDRKEDEVRSRDELLLVAHLTPLSCWVPSETPLLSAKFRRSTRPTRRAPAGAR